MGAILLMMMMLFSRTQSSMEGRNLQVLKEGEIQAPDPVSKHA